MTRKTTSKQTAEKKNKNKVKVPDCFKKKTSASKGGTAAIKLELCYLECNMALTSVERIDNHNQDHNNNMRRDTTMTLKEAFAATSDDKT